MARIIPAFVMVMMCTPALCAPTYFNDVKTDKARYSPGEDVAFTIELVNPTSHVINGSVHLVVSHLAVNVTTLSLWNITLPVSPEVQISETSWTPPERDYTGYLVEAFFCDGLVVLDHFNTAVDVSSDWSFFPRYGYISSFGPKSSSDINETIEWLNGFHINGLQFYDWQHYKYHKPLAGTVDDPASTWVDAANRETKFNTVMGYINSARERNMMCMNYNQLYGASADGYGDGLHEEWGLYEDGLHATQCVHDLPGGWATPYIMLFNPVSTNWRNYIFGEEEKAFAVFPFDGWHVDQLGENGYSWEGDWIDMPPAYGSFINEGKTRLKKRFTFNAVNEFGAPEVADEVDFVYVETWPEGGDTYRRYLGFKWMFQHCREWSGNLKNIVFAAYMNRGATGSFNKSSVLLTDAAIFATGGAHIELGDHGMLCNEYFPICKEMSGELEKTLRDYYHVATAYQNMLRDRDVIEIDRDVTSTDVTISDWDEPGRVWEFARRKRNDEILHLINLTTVPTNSWCDDEGVYPDAPVYTNMQLTYFTDSRIDQVVFVSPDYLHGSPQTLSFSTNTISGKACVQLWLPQLHYWDMIIFRTLPRTYYISRRATHTFDGASIDTAFTNIYQADQQIEYGNGDTVLIDAGTTGSALGFVYDSGGNEDEISRFQRLRDNTAANDITIEGINGMPIIKAKYPPIQFHGVRYNCRVKNLFLHVTDGAAIAFSNQRSYEWDPDVGAESKWYPASGANNRIENCVISNTSPWPAIVFGVNGDFDNREDDGIFTMLKGSVIISNAIHVCAAGGDMAGAVWFNQYGGGSDVKIQYNNIAGPGADAAGAATGVKVEWRGGKDHDFVIACNRIHDWSENALALDLGGSEIRENVIWHIGNTAIQVDGGLHGHPNRFVNNTICGVGNDCVRTQHDPWATNWWINNLFVSNANASGYVIWSGTGAGVKNAFDSCMSYDVAGSLGGDNAFQHGGNYWKENPEFVSLRPTNEHFLALRYGLSAANALYGGCSLYGGRDWLGVGGGVQGGPPLDIPEPLLCPAVLGVVLLYQKRRRQRMTR